MVPSQRKCLVCGLEAQTDLDLVLFRKDKYAKYGRRNLCNECYNKLRVYDSLKERYKDMIQRCYNSNNLNYFEYGGRGITVCMEWLKNRESFLIWAIQSGYQQYLEIDRLDNDKGYSPENCRWVDHSTQLFNRRVTTTFLDKGTRICSQCRLEKPFSEFHRSSVPKNHGYSRLCKDCKKIEDSKRRVKV